MREMMMAALVFTLVTGCNYKTEPEPDEFPVAELNTKYTVMLEDTEKTTETLKKELADGKPTVLNVEHAALLKTIQEFEFEANLEAPKRLKATKLFASLEYPRAIANNIVEVLKKLNNAEEVDEKAVSDHCREFERILGLFRRFGNESLPEIVELTAIWPELCG